MTYTVLWYLQKQPGKHWSAVDLNKDRSVTQIVVSFYEFFWTERNPTVRPSPTSHARGVLPEKLE